MRFLDQNIPVSYTKKKLDFCQLFIFIYKLYFIQFAFIVEGEYN